MEEEFLVRCMSCGKEFWVDDASALILCRRCYNREEKEK